MRFNSLYHGRQIISTCYMTKISAESNNLQTSDKPRRKRWRRRKAPISTEENISAEKTAKGVDTNQSPPESISSCPLFSMTFQRYKIDLSTSCTKAETEQRHKRRVQEGIITKLVKTNTNDKSSTSDERRLDKDNNPLNLMNGLLKGVANALPKDDTRARKAVESMYPGEKVRWISSIEKPDVDVDLHACAAFWRMAADITQKQNSNQQMWYLALSETTESVAQNLCYILNWYAEYAKGKEDNQVILCAELDSKSKTVPVVRFTVANDNKIDQQNEVQKQRQQLPSSNDTEKRTKAWVQRLLVELGICPFTKSTTESGHGLRDLSVPVADIMYRQSNALSGSSNDVYLLMADAWVAISDMITARPTGVSSILLSAPGYDDSFKLWAGPIFAMLETCVGAVQAEEMVGVVCFHPQYVTPDGKSFPGFGHMHSLPRLKKWYKEHFTSSSEQSEPSPLTDNEIAAGGAWQRRTPHAVINVLRAEQLEAAEGRRNTGELYERNVRLLVGNDEESIGLEKLAEDLKLEQCL